MTQDRSNASQGYALAKHRRGRGMSQDVSAIDWRLDSRSVQRAPHDMSDTCTRQGATRSPDGCEHFWHLQRGPTVVEIKQNRIADILW
jgi:hypothetical protein